MLNRIPFYFLTEQIVLSVILLCINNVPNVRICFAFNRKMTNATRSTRMEKRKKIHEHEQPTLVEAGTEC